MAESRNTPKKATTSKKPAAKKTAVKKVAAKKTVAKKTAAAKAPAKKAPVKKVAPKKQAPRAKKVTSDDDDMASLMAMLNNAGKRTKTSRPKVSGVKTSSSRSPVRGSSSTPAIKLPFMKEDTDKVSYGLTVLAVLMCIATLLTVFVFNGGESRADACINSKKDLRALIAQYGTAPDEVALKNAATMNAKASANCTNDDYQLFYTNEWSAWMQSVTTNSTTPVTTPTTNGAPTTATGASTGAPEGSTEDQSQGQDQSSGQGSEQASVTP
jgi:hypothetical protein